MVQGNRTELRQVFLNLVLNGIQAQPRGGRVDVSFEPEVRAKPEVKSQKARAKASRAAGRGWVVVKVRDSGPGIEPALLRQVWEPFYTTREKGSGLGLFVVKRTVEALRGRVEIASRPGQGTVVEVRLPAAAEGQTPRPPRAQREEEEASENPPG